jgi:putative membrane protein
MREQEILREAMFDEAVCKYWLLSGTILLVICVVTIPLIPLWWICGLFITNKYLEKMSCTLTDKSLIVKKGLLTRIEKTVPLEKITDLALKQGPIMRAMNLYSLSIETAGSSGSGAGGALVSLLGINETEAFRDAVLAQRDRLGSVSTPSSPPSTKSESEQAVLGEIRDTLNRIEQSMNAASP